MEKLSLYQPSFLTLTDRFIRNHCSQIFSAMQLFTHETLINYMHISPHIINYGTLQNIKKFKIFNKELTMTHSSQDKRHTASRTCIVTQTYSTFGDRAFGAAGPGLWNSLPSHLKDADLSYSEFRRSLKTFLFGQWGHGAV